MALGFEIKIEDVQLALSQANITEEELIMDINKLFSKLDKRKIEEVVKESDSQDSKDGYQEISDRLVNAYAEIVRQTKSIIKAEADVDNIVDIYTSIDLTKSTIITGTNGSGKSLVRKMIGLRVRHEMEKNARAVSMNTRTGSNPEWGALSSCMNDTEWTATSHNTYNLIQGLLNGMEDAPYIILDEFEIGCSEETVIALINLINTKLLDVKKPCLIITHSRLAVERLNADAFVNIQGLSKEEWINRDIIPTDLDSFSDMSLFCAVRDRMNESKVEKETRRKKRGV